MALGWKWLIPISLVWLVAVAGVKAVQLEGGMDRRAMAISAGVLLVLLLIIMVWPSGKSEPASHKARGPSVVPAGELTAGQGRPAFPTPPMPEGGAVRGAAAPLVFTQSGPTVRGEET
jgi:NADH-quinone oxidoreductase subunit H